MTQKFMNLNITHSKSTYTNKIRVDDINKIKNINLLMFTVVDIEASIFFNYNLHYIDAKYCIHIYILNILNLIIFHQGIIYPC